MTTPAIMLAGTGSDVGKSLIVAGLCRLFARKGLRVAPFKPQNMSNNAAVTIDGGEIGRAQALQALAAGIAPSVHMNPVLLKPQSDLGSQVVVQGRVWRNAKARDYQALKPELMASVLQSFDTLSADVDLVIVEGAGSIAEVNLRTGDIANMGFATAANVPVVLVGDIDRGGVIAQIVGTHAVVSEADRAGVKGFIVNRFRGDPTLFDDGMALIAQRTGWEAMGLVPHFAGARDLPAEDAVALDHAPDARPAGSETLEIVVLCPPRISNFDDFDPLAMEPGVNLRFLRMGEPIPGTADAVILPGSKATIADLAALRETGWEVDLNAHVRRGGHVLGICGGFQMLGRSLSDPNGIEGPPSTVKGLGLLDVATVLQGAKTLVEVQGTDAATGAPFQGYEMHIGETAGADCRHPMLITSDGRADGARDPGAGRIRGCYVHGVFAADTFRSAWLRELGGAASGLAYRPRVEATLDGLSEHLERHLDHRRLWALASDR